MGWLDRFRKKDEVVDLVELRKRGLVKDEDLGLEEENSGGIMDLSSLKSGSSSSQSGQQDSSSNPLGFLAGLASSASSDSSSSDSNLGGGADLGLPPRRRVLKEKLRDIESRMDSLSRQMQKAIDRLELLERKLERKGI